MYKRYLFIVAGLLLSGAVQAQRQAYIIDDLIIYLRRGPGAEFRMTGALTAGSRVTIEERSPDSDFIRVRDDKGRSGWIEKQFVTNEVSRRARLEEAETKLAEIEQRFASSGTEISSYQEEIAQLKKENAELKRSSGMAKSELKRLENEVAGADQSNRIRWFQSGALVLGSGMVLGLVIPYVAKRRKRYDSW
ncbi:MAG: TIGR04211 family SH3 domain-containing protein [Gammaproteobacteria bacterium]